MRVFTLTPSECAKLNGLTIRIELAQQDIQKAREEFQAVVQAMLKANDVKPGQNYQFTNGFVELVTEISEYKKA